MKIVPGNAQHQGRRNSQQDEFWFSDIHDPLFTAHGGVLALVADGMGGLEKGAEASRLAARTFGTAYLAKDRLEPIPDALKNALDEANAAVCELSRSVDGNHNVGTTLVAAVIAESSLYWLSVGDSRLYLFRHGVLTQFTQDHNYGGRLQAQVADGLLSADAADSDPDRNALTSFIGMQTIEEVDRNLRPYLLAPEDWVLLCSDGLHGVLGEAEMADILAASASPQAAADALIARTLEYNLSSQDNVTVVIMAHQNETAEPGLDKAKTPRLRQLIQFPWLWVIVLGIGLLAAAGGLAWHWFGQPPIAESPPIVVAKAPTPAPVKSSTDTVIADLMQQAQTDLENNHLTQPPGDNALEKYQQILALDANYIPATQGLQQLATLLERQAEDAIKEKNTELAQKLIESARKVRLVLDPNDKLNQNQRQLDALRKIQPIVQHPKPKPIVPSPNLKSTSDKSEPTAPPPVKPLAPPGHKANPAIKPKTEAEKTKPAAKP